MEGLALPSASQSAGQKQGQGQGHTGRRAKPTLSCNLCRRRKLRCDRQLPCQTCSSRGLSLACSYAQANHRGLAPPATRPSIQDRLVQLEQLVVNVIQNQNKPSGDSPTTLALASDPQISIPKSNADEHIDDPAAASAPSNTGRLQYNANEYRYVGGAHWSAILDGIADLREDVDKQEHNSPSSHPQLLYGCKPASRDAIMATLPPKPTVDRGVSRYFNMLDIAPSAVHSTQFLREYEKFWTAPAEAPIMWIGLLYSMLCLSALAEETADVWAGEHHSPLIDTYRERIVQCLTMGEYTNQGPYALETFFHYHTIEFSIRKDADKNIWLLLGIGVNIAMGMGYHRDASHFPGLSPLTGEMRRRMWATIVQGDILISTQMGLPRLIKEWQCDVAEPRNLNDEDFDENTKVLPPSRPETEMTTSLHIIARRRLFCALGAAVDLTAAVVPCPYSEVMRVDRMLQEAKDRIPPVLRMRPPQLSVTDSPKMLTHRLFNSVMFHKGRILLHRKYLSIHQAGEDGSAFIYSCNACLDASLCLIDVQQIFHEETRPGGLLHSARWRRSSFLHHEFLTATMILCWILYHGVDKIWHSHAPTTDAQVKTALEKAHNIWTSLSNSSRDARKASETLSLLFNNRLRQVASISNSQPEPFELTSNMNLDYANSFNVMTQFGDEYFPSLALESVNPYQMGQNPFLDMNFLGSWEPSDQLVSDDLKIPKQLPDI